MQFLKCVKVALLVSGAAFTVASLPVAKFAGERVDVQFNRSQIFSGQARDFAGAYLSIAGLISVSLGVTGFSLAAWRQTRSRLIQTKQAVSELEGLVQQREQQLQLAQLSPTRIQQTGLQAFLDEEDWAALDAASLSSPLAIPPAAQMDRAGLAEQDVLAEQGVSANRVVPANQTISQAIPVGHSATARQPVSTGYAVPMEQAVPAGYAGASSPATPVRQPLPVHQPVLVHQAASNYQPMPAEQVVSAHQSMPVAQVVPIDPGNSRDNYPQQTHRATQRPASAPAHHSAQQHQLSSSQVAQLQAVQAQLQQQHRQAQQTLAATHRATANRSTGFTVINPYQLQNGGYPRRQRSA